MVANLRETTARYKPNIAAPDDTNLHDASVFFDECNAVASLIMMGYRVEDPRSAVGIFCVRFLMSAVS